MHQVIRLHLLRVALMLAGIMGTSRAADAWTQLKVGMTRDEATEVLGQALITTKGKGFVMQIYDRGAEVVLFRGRVVTWTAPAGSRNVAPALDMSKLSQIVEAPSEVAARANNKSRKAPTLPAYRL